MHHGSIVDENINTLALPLPAVQRLSTLPHGFETLKIKL